MEYLLAATPKQGGITKMKKFNTVAVIAALAFATQAFAMGGGSKGGQATHSNMPATTKTGITMTTGTHAMGSTAPMQGTGTMSATMSQTMSTTGTGQHLMTHLPPTQPTAAQ
jgi:hypothetical protein